MEPKTNKAVQVKALDPRGFRRAGRRWGPEWSAPIALGELAEGELAALSSDRSLAVREVEVESPAPAAPKRAIDRAAIVAAIGQLEPGNKDHWTQAGAPDVRALEAVLGGQISAKDRDQAWAAAQKAKE